MIGIARKLWIVLAEDQLKKRKELFGEQADVCEGCREILICSGPISFGTCKAVDELLADGLLKGPKKIPFKRMRAKFLPVEKDCLHKYGLGIEENKLVKVIPKDN